MLLYITDKRRVRQYHSEIKFQRVGKKKRALSERPFFYREKVGRRLGHDLLNPLAVKLRGRLRTVQVGFTEHLRYLGIGLLLNLVNLSLSFGLFRLHLGLNLSDLVGFRRLLLSLLSALQLRADSAATLGTAATAT